MPLTAARTEPASYFADPADVPKLRDMVAKIAGLGYSEHLVRQRLGLEDLCELHWRPLPIYRAERLAGRDPLALAIDLLLLQGELPPQELERLFLGSERELLVRAGILAIDDEGTARVRASLYPVNDRLIFSDPAWPELPHPGYTSVPYDQVMGIGLDSRYLARCTVRRPFHSALDLCTGSGVHAVLAAAHAERVIAVDINTRAAHCARFNAQLSGAANLEVLAGDLYEVVGGQSFELITANPPFVPSPLNTLRFRDGGRSGEDVLKRIVAGLPHHLAPGGIAQIVTELGERDDEPLVLRLREWLNGAPMDIHVLRLGEYTTMKYAVGHAQGEDYASFLESVDEWSSNLRAQGYRRVVSLVVSFQWSDAASGAPWERVDESPPPRRAAGSEIERAFLAERTARRADLQQVLHGGRLRRTGMIALLDSRMLGADLRAKAKASLLGQALTMEHLLEPLEREILLRLEEHTSFPDLMKIFHDLNVNEPAVVAAIHSLLRRQLVSVDGEAIPKC